MRTLPAAGCLLLSALLPVLTALPAWAGEDPLAGGPPPPAAATDGTTAVGDYFAHWSERVHEAQSSQPGWMTPLVTVTPRLEQEVRFDQSWQQLGNGAHVTNYGGGKGLELIPTTSNEIIINTPPYLDRTYARARMVNGLPGEGTGFQDDPVLLIKQRLLSSPESQGNYILSAFLGVSAPTAATRFVSAYDTWSVTPTLAAGKGWGDFDIQATVGLQMPMAYASENGNALNSNVAFQYHFERYFWPELEVNNTYWTNGPRGGRFQTFITPGIIFGRFGLGDGAKLILGVGYQFAVTPPEDNLDPLTPLYDRALLATARVAF
ncbi:hypothetical protein GALL_237200 [mine drainage metagenome]|uniref:MetA-pathway of phenol degradation n=1 Tax=mine drainage metagenome TaxID=410659 RepID=A0A1J5RFX0_9ZZZZ